MATLARRLGYDDDAKLVIISCDDLGSCHAANVGVYGALRDGVATCASIMVPAPWARHAASSYRPADDIGVHLTLNCEHDAYRWGPITHAPSLLSGEGGFPRRSTTSGSTPIPRRCSASAGPRSSGRMAWGIDVTHLAPHLTAITLRPEFFDIYLELAVEFRLPIRLPSTISAEQAGFPFRHLAADEGVVFPDHFDHDWRAGSRERVYDAVRTCSPASPRSTCSRRSTRPRSAPSTERRRAWIDDYALVDRRPDAAASCWPPVGRRADRLPTAQGRDASRLIAAPASPLRSTLEQRARSSRSTSACRA